MVWDTPGGRLSKKKPKGNMSRYKKQGSEYAANRAKEAERIKNLPAPEEKAAAPRGPVQFKKLDSNKYP
jgi:hypothetical protein